MSQTDSFIEEVTEEVRRDRLFRLLKRWGWIGALSVILLVGGAAWNEWRKAQARSEAQATGEALLSALETQDATARAEALRTVEADDGAEAVARLLAASAALEAGETDAALEALDLLAADQEVASYYRDLATLKAVMIRGGALSPEERIAALEPLTAPGAPFRLVAEEQIALAEIDAGDRAAALERLGRLRDDTEATSGLRQRVAQLIVALGGDPA